MALRIHHLNCLTMCPLGFAALMPDRQDHMVAHCLLIESEAGLILVDTGCGLDDLRDRSRLGAGFWRVARPRVDEEQTALRQIERLGFSRADVRHILPTHLDLDHAGGLPDFPEAKVHLFRPELEAATQRATFMERERYRPVHFAHGPKFVPYEVQGEAFLGFEAVRALEGLPPEIFLVPTIGHSRGHVAVVVDDGDGYRVHAGDAYFHHDEMNPEKPSCPAPLKLFQRIAAIDDLVRKRNAERLRVAARDASLKIFCAHDPSELSHFQSHESPVRPYQRG